MRRTFLVGMALTLLAAGVLPARAGGAAGSSRWDCGGRFDRGDSCSLEYRGGHLSVSMSTGVHGVVEQTDAGQVRLEARDRRTGERVVLLSCTIAGGGCAAAGDPLIHLRKGQRLFCIAAGTGRGFYGCTSHRAD